MNNEKIRLLEAELRAISTELWSATVDDPETATVDSEEDGMTPERIKLREAYRSVDTAIVLLEQLALGEV